MAYKEPKRGTEYSSECAVAELRKMSGVSGRATSNVFAYHLHPLCFLPWKLQTSPDATENIKS